MNQPLVRLLLFRHAEVEARYQKVFGGTIDMEISPQGHQQSVVLAEFLKTRSFDALYASPMKRVQQTLAPSLTNGHPTPTVLSGLREVDFGAWTGHGWDAVLEKFGARAHTWLDQLERGTIPQAEQVAAYRARVQAALNQILADANGKCIGVFCHGGVIRMMLSILIDLPLSKTSVFEIDYASVTEIHIQPHRVEIRLLNFAPWRDWKS